ncbi:calcium/sodium antiporter [Mariluticola halotolerans]|uniref:calcium/sodium antiporter n=1 Tax=Mariluticola halotolerans TaxID=2909283 RepID=UPI0026E39579|nr:calcium/sodium antiporter [Mariluticola halotolerans]UJQ94450.1 calcium/sodium antiporter [Mariluticola halotolerans]
MAIVTLIAGLILLVLAGDALVRGAVSVAQRASVPPIIIGLTIVAFGTSAPELIVSVEAALKRAPGLAIGNVVGSNITNILLVLGLPAIITPIVLAEDGIRRSTVFMILISLGLAFMAMNGIISRLDGLFLIALLVVYLGYSGFEANKANRANVVSDELEELSADNITTKQIALLLGFGVVGLGFGGKMVTEGALDLAAMLGVADTAVGLTIVALGTSLPELATSLAAALRKQTGVVIGNVLGSNIFNALGIIGITSLLVPLDVSSSIINFDIWVMLAAALLMAPVAFMTRRVSRFGGVIMLLAYIIYTIVVFRNGMAI